MISRDLFLTCGHLFDQTGGGWERPRQNGTSNIISPQQIATNMHLNFDYQVDQNGNLRQEQSFAITELVEYRLGGVDMAICRIAGNPGAIYGWTQVSQTDAALDDMLCIIGHPAGVPKRVEAGPATDFSGVQVRYNDIDTLGGNSGSGILQATTGSLVGVHTNGGCTAEGGFNYGMRISSIRNVSPTIQNLRTTDKPLIDDIVTRPSFDQAKLGFSDKAVIDDIRTSVVQDLRTSLSRDKAPVQDVRKTALQDSPVHKRVTDVKSAGFDLRRDIDPGRAMNLPPASRPFVLSTPHHAPVGPGVEGSASSQYESGLASLAEEIEAQQQVLEILVDQYEAVLAEYQQLLG